MTPLLEVSGLSVRFPAGSRFGRRWLQAVDGVSFRLERGDSLGIVGESGCGKSTLGRAVLGLVKPQAGDIRLAGAPLAGSRARRQVQMVFQDPRGSLDPRMTAGQSVAEPLDIFQPELTASTRHGKVLEALARVGLGPDDADHYPHELSGGQCQRVGIARATILRPPLVVCDEPVSALDVSVQGQVVNLLAELRRELGLSYLFISHNLAVVRHVSSHVLVMYLGRVLEHAARESLYARPRHPYTRALLDAVPGIDPAAATPTAPLAGEPPSPWDPPAGCAFHNRCRHAVDICTRSRPPLEQSAAGHVVACHRRREWPDGLPAA